ncbi:MAG: S-layer homology domain-containing protein [Sporomusaceae bacterium]|nr:S-layer homology domain-containing protein [Sporomusaceae bacterium]
MKKISIKLVSIILMLFLFSQTVLAETDASVSVNTGGKTTIAVYIEASGVQNLYSGRFKLKYNSQQLQFVEASPVYFGNEKVKDMDTKSSLWYTVQQQVYGVQYCVDTEGSIDYLSTQLGSPVPVANDAVIAKLIFNVMGGANETIINVQDSEFTKSSDAMSGTVFSDATTIIPSGVKLGVYDYENPSVELIAPTGTIKLNQGAAVTSSMNATLQLTVRDNATTNEFMKMYISNDPVTNIQDIMANQWENFSAEKSWTLKSENGSKTVYVVYKDEAGNASIVYSCAIELILPTPTPSPTPSNNRGGKGASVTTPAPEITTPIVAVVTQEHPRIEVAKPVLDSTAKAQVTVTATAINDAVAKATVDTKGVKTVTLEIAKVEGAKAYEPNIPTSFLTSTTLATSTGTAAAATQATLKIEIKTEIASVVVPNNMLSASNITSNADNTSSTTIAIGSVDKSQLDAVTRAQIGNRPVIELNLKIDGKAVSWSNPEAPVKVSLPYTPTEEELKNPEHIVIWYIDEAGKATPVPSGKYNPATQSVSFITTHFSKYAIGYIFKSFNDMADFAWAKSQVEVLASKGVIGGTSDTTYTPNANITRADFLLLLIKSLGLSAKVDSNFSDVSESDYYYESVGIAKKLGISQGEGNNLYNPKAQISRQDMMVLAVKAMKIAGSSISTGASSDIANFADKSKISSYAVDSIAAMVKDGLIKGDGTNIYPNANATRAEAAVLIYGIYNKNK